MKKPGTDTKQKNNKASGAPRPGSDTKQIWSRAPGTKRYQASNLRCASWWWKTCNFSFFFFRVRPVGCWELGGYEVLRLGPEWEALLRREIRLLAFLFRAQQPAGRNWQKNNGKIGATPNQKIKNRESCFSVRKYRRTTKKTPLWSKIKRHKSEKNGFISVNFQFQVTPYFSIFGLEGGAIFAQKGRRGPIFAHR